jgi:PQQ-dependent catabolism-associated CXXCW motif protein
MWKLVALLLAWLVASVTMSVADETLFDPVTGYRISRYRSPTPERVPGGTRIMAADVSELINTQRAILIDVMPSEGGRPEPKSGQWYLLKPHQNIAGSTWLADVGLGVLNPDQSSYFTKNIARLTHGDVSRAVIFYCKADCWMAWNAVRRAAALGYQNIYWLSEGTDGWTDWGGDLVDAKPEPFPAERRNSSNSAAKP